MSEIVQVGQKLICSPNGEVLLTVVEDHEEVCKEVHNAKMTTKGWTKDRTMKLSMSIPMQEYIRWKDELGDDCWEDNSFRKWHKAHTKGRYCI